MPKKRSHSKKRTKTYTKRSSHRKRSAPIIRGINYVRQRFVSVQSVVPNPNTTQTNISCIWQQTADGTQPAPIANNIFLSYNQAPRWDQVVRNYDQYSLSGMKIEWIPMVTQQLMAPQQNIASLTTFFKMDDLDSYGTLANASTNSIITAPGFKSLNPFRPWKRYYSMKKLSKEMNVPWQDNQAYLSTQPNTLTPAGTLLRWNHTAAAPQTPTAFGILKVTWYCHMRGQVAP